MLVDKHPQLGLFPGCFRCWFCIQLESFAQSLAAIRSSTRLRSNALVLAAAFFEGKTVGASWSCEIQNLVGLYAEHWTCEVIRTQGAGKKRRVDVLLNLGCVDNVTQLAGLRALQAHAKNPNTRADTNRTRVKLWSRVRLVPMSRQLAASDSLGMPGCPSTDLLGFARGRPEWFTACVPPCACGTVFRNRHTQTPKHCKLHPTHPPPRITRTHKKDTRLYYLPYIPMVT